MKLLITILSLSLVTGIVACNKKNSGGGATQPQQPIYPYTHSGNDLYMGPDQEIGNIPGTIIDLPGCITPPPIFSDIYQECAWLAVTTDCDTEATNQRFINRCYGLNLNRPGCSFPSQPITCRSNCSSSLESTYDNTIYSGDSEPRRTRVVHTERRVIRDDRREPVRTIVDSNSAPSPVSMQPSVVSSAEPRVVVANPVVPVEEKISFDNSKCQWIVQLHNRLQGGQSWSSWSRSFVSESNLTGLARDQKQKLANLLLNDISVLPDSNRPEGSALGNAVSIEDNQLIINDKTEEITKCTDREIITIANEGAIGITRTYTWDKDFSEQGEVYVRSRAELINASLNTVRIVLWKQAITSENVKSEFEKDSRVQNLNQNLLEKTLNFKKFLN